MINATMNSKHPFSTPNQLVISVTVDGTSGNEYRELAEEVCKELFDSKDKGFVIQVMRMTNELRSKLEAQVDQHFINSTFPYTAHFAISKEGRVVESAN